MTLVDLAGSPLRNRKGEKYEARVKPDENAHVIASRLVKRRLQEHRGEKKDFWRPLNYGPTGLKFEGGAADLVALKYNGPGARSGMG